jgi:hypothetical protein
LHPEKTPQNKYFKERKMKRFTAILAVLCVAFTAFSCSGGESTAPAKGTSAQNTAESIKTESTTSTTEAPEKPEFLHPAIEEINESIDKMYASDSFFAGISTSFNITENSIKHPDTTVYTQTVSLESKENGKKVFLIKTDGEKLNTVTGVPKQTEFFEKSVFFDGESYYISHLGIDAKIPESGVSSITSPEELIYTIAQKFTSDKEIPYFDIEIDPDTTRYSYCVPGEFLDTTFKPLISALEEEIRKRTDTPTELDSSASAINIWVNADGTLSTYSVVLSTTVSLSGEKPRVITVETVVSLSFSYSAGAPTAPDGAEDFIPLRSEQDIPLTVLKNAAEKTAESKILSSCDTFEISKKELDGSITSIDFLSNKVSDGAGIAESVSSVKLTGGTAYSSVDASLVFAGGNYYVRKTIMASPLAKPTETKTVYSPEDFENIYGPLGMHVPHVTEGSDAVFSPYIPQVGKDGVRYTLEFSVGEEAFLGAFGEQTERVALAVADGHEIWKYNVKNCKVTAAIGTDGKITAYSISFETEVYVIINGKKFAFKAEASGTSEFSSAEQNITVTIPQDAKSYTKYTPETQS